MSEFVAPEAVLDLIASQIPPDLQPNILIVGSLAAAYHHRAKLQHHAVRTKDADIVIQPAGALTACREIATRLFDAGWTPTENCSPALRPSPDENLSAIRLHPPGSDVYFVELLGFPEADQVDGKHWIPIELPQGWYGIPCFKFLGLVEHERLPTPHGFQYAAPAMMALANLLAHPALGIGRLGKAIGAPGRKPLAVLRSAKDLGRVLALTRLASRDEVEAWLPVWEAALKSRFPTDWRHLARTADSGLRQLLADKNALEEARHAVDVGLLDGLSVTTEQLGALGQQLIADVLEPLARRAAHSD